MEQHPIPRNITGFQFKLIGDMTLRQFGYLAGGAVIGYALFKLLPLPFILNLSCGGFVFFLGFAFAFLPYADRPLDQWLVAFLKSVNSPTQYIYLKENPPPEILTTLTSVSPKKITGFHAKNYADSKKMLDAYLSKLPQNPVDFYDQNEKMALTQTLSLFAQTPQTQPVPEMVVSRNNQQTPKPPPASPIILEAKKQRVAPQPVHLAPPKQEKKEEKPEEEQNQLKQLTQELAKLRQQVQENSQTNTVDPNLAKRFLELEQKLTTLLTEREKLTGEIAKLQQKESYAGKTVTPQVAAEEPKDSSRVKIISQQQATSIGLINAPTTPNIVIGVVNDQNNASLENVLITVKDMRGTPLRALKTNKLGQFFASTPLPNGNYVLEVEDPQKRYAFDLIEIKLTGEIVQPLVITAKKQVDPLREKLAKELFQKNF